MWLISQVIQSGIVSLNIICILKVLLKFGVVQIEDDENHPSQPIGQFKNSFWRWKLEIIIA